MEDDEFLQRKWLVELNARPRTATDLAFWRSYRAGENHAALASGVAGLSDEYLEELLRHTRSPGLRAILKQDWKQRRRRWLGPNGRLRRYFRVLLG